MLQELPNLRIPEWQVNELHVDCPTDDQTALVARAAARSSIEQCLQHDIATSTEEAYQNVLAAEVGRAQKTLDLQLLPMTSETQFFSLFGHMHSHYGSELPWAKVRILRAALAQWHKRQGIDYVCSRWSPTMASFWNGLSREAKHSGPGKLPVPFEDVVAVLKKAIVEPSSINVRNAAMISVAFFGVRRGAES